MFFAYFLGLLCLSLTCILFLFQSHSKQQQRISQEEKAFNELQNQQFVLSGKIDSLVRDLRLLNSGQVENNMYLMSSVNIRRMDLERTYRNTDTSAFIVYGRIIGQIRNSIMLKDSIGLLSNQETFMRNALNACISSYNRSQKKEVSFNSDRFR